MQIVDIVIYIAPGQPYTLRYGHSPVSTKGMVGKSIAKYKRIIRCVKLVSLRAFARYFVCLIVRAIQCIIGATTNRKSLLALILQVLCHALANSKSACKQSSQP